MLVPGLGNVLILTGTPASLLAALVLMRSLLCTAAQATMSCFCA